MPRPYIVAFSLVLTWLLSSAGATTFSGLLLTKQSRAIAFCKLHANSDTGETSDFTTNRGGAFSVDLGNGVWTILADSEQIQQWGFAQMNVSIAIAGETSLARNLTLLASEPLRTPSLTFSRPDARTWKLSVKGQGGTIVKIESSKDMVTWTPYNAVAISTTGVTLSDSSATHMYFSRMFFRASASSQ